MAIIRPRSSRGSALVTLEDDLIPGAMARKVPRNADGQCGVDELLKFLFKYQFASYCESILIVDLDNVIPDYNPYSEAWEENTESKNTQYVTTNESGSTTNSLFKCFNGNDPNHYSMILMAVAHIAKHSRDNKGLNINRVVCFFNPDDDDDTSFTCTIELKKPSSKRTIGSTKHKGINVYKNSSLPYGARNDGK